MEKSSENVSVKLPSGAKLDITLSDWKLSKKVLNAITLEAERMNIDISKGVRFVLGQVMLRGVHSEVIEAAIWDCMGRVTYNDRKIDEDTFQPRKARGDYLQVLFEVAAANVSPFTESLASKFAEILASGEGYLASKFPQKPKTS